MAVTNDPNDPNATPDFDEWGPDSFWLPGDWLIWHGALKKEFGQPIANDLWLKAWNSRSWIAAFGDVRGDWIAFDTEFRDYLEQHLSSSGMTMLAAASDPLSNFIAGGVDIVESAGSGLQNTLNAAERTTKTLNWLLPVVLIGLAAIILFKVYQFNPIKT